MKLGNEIATREGGSVWETQLKEIQPECTVFHERIINLFKPIPKCLKKLVNREFDMLVFMNKDVYDLCTPIIQQECQADIKCILENCIEDIGPDKFIGKTIILFDLTFTTGYKLFERYCKLKKFGAKVISAIYGRSIETTGVASLQKMYQIYYDTFGILDTSEDVKHEADIFYRDWHDNFWIYTYRSQNNITAIKLAMLKLFHQDLYLQFENEKYNTRIFQQIQSLVICSENYKIPIEEVKSNVQQPIDDILQFMQGLGVIEINNSFLQCGKNADWLLCKEGRMFYFCAESLYNVLGSTCQGFLLHLEPFMLDAKEYCSKVCQEFNQVFDEDIFMKYVDWYKYIGVEKQNIHRHIMGKLYLTRNMQPIEMKISNEMKLRSEEIFKSEEFFNKLKISFEMQQKI